MSKFLYFLAFVFLLSSCSNRLGIMKRRYNKGYYISHGSDPARTSVAKQTKTKHPAEASTTPASKKKFSLLLIK